MAHRLVLVICAWCVKADRPAFLREQPPYHDPSVSHGICPAHREEWLAALRTRQAERSL